MPGFKSTQTATYNATGNSYSFAVPEDRSANSNGETFLGQVAYDGVGTTDYSLFGTDASKLRIDSDGNVFLLNGHKLDHEGEDGLTSLSFDISLLFEGDDGSFDLVETKGTSLSVTDVDEAPTLLDAKDGAPTAVLAVRIAENKSGVDITELFPHDDDGDLVVVRLRSHKDSFEIIHDREAGTYSLKLKEGVSFDHESLANEVLDIDLILASNGASGTQVHRAKVQLTVKDTNDTAPVFTSPYSAETIAENSGAGQVVYTAQAKPDVAGHKIVYSLAGEDAAHFSINKKNGKVTLKADPNSEDKSLYLFDVIAKVGKQSATKHVSLKITDVDEVPEAIVLSASSIRLNYRTRAKTGRHQL